MYHKRDNNVNINKRATIYDNDEFDIRDLDAQLSPKTEDNALWNIGSGNFSPRNFSPDTWSPIGRRTSGWNYGPVKTRCGNEGFRNHQTLNNGNPDSGYIEYAGDDVGVVGGYGHRKSGSSHKVGPCHVPLLGRTGTKSRPSGVSKCPLNVTDYYIKADCHPERTERSPSVSSSCSSKKVGLGGGGGFWDSMGECCVKRKEPPEKHKDKSWKLGPWKQDGYVDMQQKRGSRVSTSSCQSRNLSLRSHRYDSLRKIDPSGHMEDEEQLKQHTWYQAGIPREIALEILMQQEIGSFIVRDSTTHPGCYALSVKVPKFENPAGISHYLIHRTPSGGVKLKGLDKEWPNLMALVIHHTVMPEMLACTLRLPRNSNNPAFNEIERDEKEEDEDYQKLSDFSTMMAELKKV